MLHIVALYKDSDRAGANTYPIFYYTPREAAVLQNVLLGRIL